jgi:hypothetical protein
MTYLRKLNCRSSYRYTVVIALCLGFNVHWTEKRTMTLGLYTQICIWGKEWKMKFIVVPGETARGFVILTISIGVWLYSTWLVLGNSFLEYLYHQWWPVCVQMVTFTSTAVWRLKQSNVSKILRLYLLNLKCCVAYNLLIMKQVSLNCTTKHAVGILTFTQVFVLFQYVK